MIRRIVSIILIIFVIAAVGGLISVSIFVIDFVKWDNQKKTERADYTRWSTPLDEIVVRDLCDKFEIPDTHPYCQLNAVVYAAEFNEYIKKYFYAMPVDETNYDAVQEKLADYLEYEEPVSRSSNRTATFRCHYDLSGDNIYRIIVWFYEDGRLRKVTTTGGGS